MPYASKAQQAMFNARAAAGDPTFIRLARDFNQKTYGRPGFTNSGARTDATGETKGGPAKFARLPTHVKKQAKETRMAGPAPGPIAQIANSIASRGPISPAVRAKTATFHQPGRTGGPTARFPMPDKKHARLALQMLPRAKNMPPGMPAKVRARAQNMLGL